MIQTVCGPIHKSELGFTHSHEHIYIAKGRDYDRIADLSIENADLSLKELKEFYDCGGRAIADAQPLGCGRDPEVLYKLSQLSKVSIIACTGFHKRVFYPKDHRIFTLNYDALYNIFLSELESGMYEYSDSGFSGFQTQYRAGFIKTAYDCEFESESYQRLFHAAFDAFAVSRAPMMIHIDNGIDMEPLMSWLKSEKANFERIIFCHMDRAVPDFSGHIEVLEMGAYLEYDTIARPTYHSDEAEIALIKSVIREGYCDRLLMGLDTTRQRLKAYGGNIGLTYIKDVFCDKMLNFGMDEKMLNKFFIINPANAFDSRCAETI